MTDEQAGAWKQLRGLATPLRLKVVEDAEGYPVVRGRVGDIEWFHAEGVFLAAYTAGSRHRLGTILSLPGVIRHQGGDTEARVLFAVAALPHVAEVLRARRRARRSPAQLAVLAAGRVPFARRPVEKGPVLPPPTPVESDSDSDMGEPVAGRLHPGKALRLLGRREPSPDGPRSP